MTNLPNGYTVKISEIGAVQGRRAWGALVRHKSWQPGCWKIVSSDYGPIAYTSPEYARAGAKVWIEQNKSIVAAKTQAS